MASLASQVILHPAASSALKVLGTTVGRDKLYRAVQYFARFYAWLLLARGNQYEATRWNTLKSHLALARKLMRLGKPLEHLQAALRAASGTGELKEQVTTIARQLGYFGYLTYDAIVWANSVRFFVLKPETAKIVNKRANQFWVAGIAFSIAHCVFKTARITAEIQSLRNANEKDIGSDNARLARLNGLDGVRSATRRQLLIDILDFWIPATNVGLVNINDGILGIFGFITSLIAFQAQWVAVTSK